MKYALITGGSEGIGKALSEECARRGWNILMVALPDPHLNKTAAELQKKYPNIHIDTFGIDLTEKEAPYQVHDWLASSGYTVKALINNVGVGYAGLFETYATTEFFDVLLQLNIRAMVLLTRLLLPELHRHNRAFVLNISSLNAYQPAPYQAVYGGSKAFAYHFTRALRNELKNSNISVSVLCPGGTNTNGVNRARNDAQPLLIRWSILEPEKVAKEAISGMLRGKSVIIPGRMNKLIRFLSQFVPIGLRIKISAKALKPKEKYDIQYAGKLSE